MLLAMLFDDRPYVRMLAVRRIRKVRANNNDDEPFRVFEVPKLNFNVVDYTEMVDWNLEKHYEPQLTKFLTNDQLNLFVDNPHHPLFDKRKKYLNHTQAVERGVKLVKEASSSVCGYESRHGLINSKIKPRKTNKVFNTNKDLNV